ncbi:MAG: hypothetical protein N3G22_04535 [Candidatus Micrarchaeota archaeon]|nr:hypothetical protein [Candidatus Micrarchaeota archaeon]
MARMIVRFALMASVFLLILGGLSFAGTASCADGTKHWECSTKFPGQVCVDGKLYNYLKYCPCSNFPGYVQQGEGENAVCVAAKCPDGTEDGKCSATKPKQCVKGVLVDNAAVCGCPAGKRPAADGKFCEFIPCDDAGTSVPEGTCSPKREKKCVNGILTPKATECGCPPGKTAVGEKCLILCTDGTEDGKCSATKPKKCVNGYLLDDAESCGCPEGQVAVGKQCATSTKKLGKADMIAASATNQTGESASGKANALSCCCLPTALIGIVAGFILLRKRD